jgi:predicted ester cyclase
MRYLLPAALASLVVFAGAAPASADLDANKRLVRAYIETAINKRQPDAVEYYLATDFVEHNPRLPPGLAGKKQFIASLLAGFSDYHGEVQEMLAESDKIVTRTRWTGTQDGPFLGRPATGNKVDFTTADFFRIENDRIVEHWDVVDTPARNRKFADSSLEETVRSELVSKAEIPC